MRSAIAKGATVELLGTQGAPYAVGVVHVVKPISKKTVSIYMKSAKRKRTEEEVRQMLGDYEYYVVGEGFGTWVYATDLRPVERTV